MSLRAQISSNRCQSVQLTTLSNGCVERANDSTRVEFWNLYDGELTVAGRTLAYYQHFHNPVRPHQALDWKIPNEYLQNIKDYPMQSHIP